MALDAEVVVADDPYSKITRRMWSDERFLRLSAPKPNARVLWIYLLSGKRCTAIAGLLPVGVLVLAGDLKWSVGATRKCLAEIETEGMAVVDHSVDLIWLPNAVTKHNMPSNPSVVVGWASAWRALPECSLRTRAGHAIRQTLMVEDERRTKANKPGGLAAAFAVVLGEASLSETGLRVGRPRKLHEEQAGEQEQEHHVPSPVPQDHGVGVKRQDQEKDQEQDQEIQNTHTAGACDDTPHPPAGETWNQMARRLAPSNTFAADVHEQLESGRKLSPTPAQRKALVRIDEQQAGAPPPKATPSEGATWTAARWAGAREASRPPLAPGDPSPRHCGELWDLATKAADQSAAAAAKRGRSWAPTAREVVAFWIREYLRADPPRSGSDVLEHYPLAMLVAKCRDGWAIPTSPGQVRGTEPEVRVQTPEPTPLDAATATALAAEPRSAAADDDASAAVAAAARAAMAAIGSPADGPGTRPTRHGVPLLRAFPGGAS